MKKLIAILVIGYMALCFALVGWMFGCPKSYGKFITKWQKKLVEGMED